MQLFHWYSWVWIIVSLLLWSVFSAFGEQFQTCADYMQSTTLQSKLDNDFYEIVNGSSSSINVFCVFDYDNHYAWTLIESSTRTQMISELQNKNFDENYPQNTNNPTLSSITSDVYRLSLNWMQFLQSKSEYMLASCNLNTNFATSNDWMLMNINNIGADLLYNWLLGECINVVSINVRGYQCKNSTVYAWQELTRHLHIQSADTSCDCQTISTGSVFSEDNFGSYTNYNTDFSCTERDNSTTNWWFGDYVATNAPSNVPTGQPTSDPTNQGTNYNDSDNVNTTGSDPDRGDNSGNNNNDNKITSVLLLVIIIIVISFVGIVVLIVYIFNKRIKAQDAKINSLTSKDKIDVGIVNNISIDSAGSSGINTPITVENTADVGSDIGGLNSNNYHHKDKSWQNSQQRQIDNVDNGANVDHDHLGPGANGYENKDNKMDKNETNNAASGERYSVTTQDVEGVVDDNPDNRARGGGGGDGDGNGDGVGATNYGSVDIATEIAKMNDKNVRDAFRDNNNENDFGDDVSENIETIA